MLQPAPAFGLMVVVVVVLVAVVVVVVGVVVEVVRVLVVVVVVVPVVLVFVTEDLVDVEVGSSLGSTTSATNSIAILLGLGVSDAAAAARGVRGGGGGAKNSRSVMGRVLRMFLLRPRELTEIPQLQQLDNRLSRDAGENEENRASLSCAVSFVRCSKSVSKCGNCGADHWPEVPSVAEESCLEASPAKVGQAQFEIRASSKRVEKTINTRLNKVFILSTGRGT
mmetsp:Transcript_7580/g.16590  ORF Transcript_7580/g.16590 Transcript_7580/m.16590 type:complete len:224 (+) Transcript_7580:632-1303(+)